MLDLGILQAKLDAALASETPDSLKRWLLELDVNRILCSDLTYFNVLNSTVFDLSPGREDFRDTWECLEEMPYNQLVNTGKLVSAFGSDDLCTYGEAA